MSQKNKNIQKKVSKNSNQEDNSEDIMTSLYKKSVEILNNNKTLSLLKKLYQTSILTLNPKDLAARMSRDIQIDLNFEIVGIFTFNEKVKSLIPLAFSNAKRIQDFLFEQGLSFEKFQISLDRKESIYKRAFETREEVISDDLYFVWREILDEKQVKSLISGSHIKTTIICPLVGENKMLGIIMLSLNRDYQSLNAFEKDAINSFTNVIALALEKASLYQELKNANAQLQELDRQKDELLSIVSHQLATPVSSVKWYLEMLMDGDLGQVTKEQKEHISTMQGVTTNLGDLVSMILDVSRIQLGKMKIEKQELDLAAFFREILDVIEPKAKEKGVELGITMPTTFPKAMLDKRYTRMTVENLLSNAVKYTPAKGAVNFLVEIRGDHLYCEVKDTGCGIPKSEQDKIFGKLFRASNVRNAVDGNGFGLYVAKGAIEAQGGKIWFASEENKGTTFFVDLPLP